MAWRVLFDTNVILDVLLKRTRWLEESQALWHANETGKLVASVTATTVTDIHYVVRRQADHQAARLGVRVCLDAFEVLPVDRITLMQANRLSGFDFEDNVQLAAALTAQLDAIVTRDVQDFQEAPLPVWSPAECLQRLSGMDDQAPS